MPDTPTRQSPIHHLLEGHEPRWSQVGGARIALRFGSDDAERAAMQTLGLCDLSGLAKLGVKGPASESWLADQGINAASGVYDSSHLADGGLIVRFAVDEFLLEGGITNDVIPALEAAFDSSPDGVFRAQRQEATFILVGSRALEVLAQTCGVNFRESAPRRLVMTHVTGVSCGIFPDSLVDTSAFRLWVDPSYAIHLWETLVQICEDLDGRVIGGGCLFPELQ